MYKFSKVSLSQLESCHPELQRLANLMIQHRDFSVLEGHRGKEMQNYYFEHGQSKVRWPHGKHNKFPSMAFDIVPWPQPPWCWKPSTDTEKRLARDFWVEWGSWVVGFAAGIGIKLRWGFDWDRDHDLNDQTFYDGPHFELIEEVANV